LRLFSFGGYGLALVVFGAYDSYPVLAFFEYENKKGVVRILIIFPVQPYHSRGLGDIFSLMWLNTGFS